MTVIAYAIGEFMAAFIPRKGVIGSWFNPFPFNSKEHAFIVIMASAAATNAVSTEILAAQRLYYNMDPSPGAAIFLVISSQLLGFGIAGLLRSVLVQPTRYVKAHLYDSEAQTYPDDIKNTRDSSIIKYKQQIKIIGLV